MAKRRPIVFTDRELDVMSVLWRLGSGTVAIDPAEPLALAVQAQAGTLTLLVDGQVVERIADAGPHAGRVGTYVEAGEDDLPHTSRFDFIRVSDPALP